jgi:hypothetical protein
MKSRSIVFIFTIGIICMFTVPSYAGDVPLTENPEKMLSEKYKGKSYSPYASRDFPNELLWGDSHLHTGLSFDAGSAGAILLPEDAYRFAWLAVTDHTDNMGFIVDLKAGNPDILATSQGKDWHDRLKKADKER